MWLKWIGFSTLSLQAILFILITCILPVRVITLLSAVCGTCRSAVTKNPFFAPKMCPIVGELLDQVPIHVSVTWTSACQAPAQLIGSALDQVISLTVYCKKSYSILIHSYVLKQGEGYPDQSASCTVFVRESPGILILMTPYIH